MVLFLYQDITATQCTYSLGTLIMYSKRTLSPTSKFQARPYLDSKGLLYSVSASFKSGGKELKYNTDST